MMANATIVKNLMLPGGWRFTGKFTVVLPRELSAVKVNDHSPGSSINKERRIVSAQIL